MLGFLVRILLLVAATVTSWFVAKDAVDHRAVIHPAPAEELAVRPR